MSGIIELENLSFGYTPKSLVLEDISFEVKPGTFLAIVGPNGAGKSTLLNLLCRRLVPKSGSIRIDAAAIESFGPEALAAKIAVVRQGLTPIFGFSVIETVLMARTPYYNQIGFENKADRQIVNEALMATDTAQFASRPLGSLSGGEQQRVFIARALAQETSILLLDEPTSFLDLKHQVDIYDLLKAAQLEKGKTIVAVTHDINLAAQYCDEVLLLEGTTSCPGTPESQNAIRANSKYHIGKTQDVFSQKQIEKVFGVRVFTGKVGQERFLIPLGKFAKDSTQINSNPDSQPRK